MYGGKQCLYCGRAADKHIGVYVLPHVRRGSALGEKKQKKTELSGMLGITSFKSVAGKLLSVAWTCGGIKKTNTEGLFFYPESVLLIKPPTDTSAKGMRPTARAAVLSGA